MSRSGSRSSTSTHLPAGHLHPGIRNPSLRSRTFAPFTLELIAHRGVYGEGGHSTWHGAGLAASLRRSPLDRSDAKKAKPSHNTVECVVVTYGPGELLERHTIDLDVHDALAHHAQRVLEQAGEPGRHRLAD